MTALESAVLSAGHLPVVQLNSRGHWLRVEGLVRLRERAFTAVHDRAAARRLGGVHVVDFTSCTIRAQSFRQPLLLQGKLREVLRSREANDLGRRLAAIGALVASPNRLPLSAV